MFPPSMSTRQEHLAHDADASIRLTDTDAAIARLSAAQKGYIHDPFVKYFVPPTPGSGESRQTGKHRDALAAYVELDFPEVTSKKAMAIRKSKDLSTVLGSPNDIRVEQGGTALHAPRYHLLPADLRHPPSSTFGTLLVPPDNTTGPILTPTLPTLLLFECVVVYMEPSASDAILRWFVEHFSTEKSLVGAVVYEMFGLQDAFGKVMVKNLKSRNVSLPGAEPYPTIDALPRRFLNTGFTAARALTLREIRQSCISQEELGRLSTLEMLDEVEELDLVLEHYAVTWGLLLPANDEHAAWGGWGLREQR
ncbi:putative leucine carboxyl methyltransferase [Lyophyllum shimeji]|uniref:Leucine carboxyl methyltransferase 1 n=1 Tax=Lyophyllum shimeji TaxID=47721 RepID=A0A9P3PLX8_LYOSH|nr:putative leucine carboxyl methyltransferase [Lyophyllum shimeji]